MVLEQKRLALHDYLCGVLGSQNVYYSPPTGMKMKYPCVIYELAGDNAVHADNIPYLHSLEWSVTVVDEDPDSEIAAKFFDLPKCRFDRPYAADDLNHFVFTLNY